MKNNISLLSPKNPKPFPSDMIKILLSVALPIINLGFCDKFIIFVNQNKDVTIKCLEVVFILLVYGSIYNIHAFINLLLLEI